MVMADVEVGSLFKNSFHSVNALKLYASLIKFKMWIILYFVSIYNINNNYYSWLLSLVVKFLNGL